MEQKELKTRLEEFIIPTSDPEEMAGKYLAADVVREWQDSFLDEESGELVDITRTELIMRKGEFLSADNISTLSFYLQTGDIKSVSVSNIKRPAVCIEVGKNTIWSITVSGGGYTKRRKYILYAQSLDQALTIARDYLEQTLSGTFKIEAAKSFTSCIVIPEDNFTKVATDSEGNIVKDEEPISQPEFYHINTAVKTKDGTRDFVWLLMATSVDDAKVRIHKYIDGMIQEGKDKGNDGDSWEGYEMTVQSGTGANVNSVIPKTFSEAYFSWAEAEEIANNPDKLLKAFDKALAERK